MQELEDTVVRLKARLHGAEMQLEASSDADPGAEFELLELSWREGAGEDSDSVSQLLNAQRVAKKLHRELAEQKAASAAVKTARDEERIAHTAAEAILAKARDELATKLVEAEQLYNEQITEGQSSSLKRLDEVQTGHAAAIAELTARNERARERTLELLTEKDTEIARLRSQLGLAGSGAEKSPSAGAEPRRLSPHTLSKSSTLRTESSGQSQATIELGRLSAGGPLLQTAWEERERERAVTSTRAEIRELSDALSDSHYKEELRETELKALKEEIRRLDANKKREGANLEYLKNVVVEYMKDQIGHEQLIKAIATILHFSRKELAEIKAQQQKQTGSWFGGILGSSR